jgi:hypothetical protein
MEDLMPFQFVAPDIVLYFSSDHLSELFGSVVTDDHLSSDEAVDEKKV